MADLSEALSRISLLFQRADAHSGVAFNQERSDAIANAICTLIEAVITGRPRDEPKWESQTQRETELWMLSGYRPGHASWATADFPRKQYPSATQAVAAFRERYPDLTQVRWHNTGDLLWFDPDIRPHRWQWPFGPVQEVSDAERLRMLDEELAAGLPTGPLNTVAFSWYTVAFLRRMLTENTQAWNSDIVQRIIEHNHRD